VRFPNVRNPRVRFALNVKKEVEQKYGSGSRLPNSLFYLLHIGSDWVTHLLALRID
jgi:hypothetical protein